MRIVVLVSGSGTNLQAVIDAAASGELAVDIAAVGSDVPGCGGLKRAEAAGILLWPAYGTPFQSLYND